MDRTVALREVINHYCEIEVEGTSANLPVARNSRPVEIGGIRVYVADTKVVGALTTEEAFPDVHRLLTKDALICLSNPELPLLDPDRFAFPIDRSDGFQWSMDENSHTFAYLNPNRTHEGTDIDLSEARGRRIHALVAIEDGIVRWVSPGSSPSESCVLLESARSPGRYYVYQHLFKDHIDVTPGQAITKGERIGHIWGDRRWGHLHFAVLGQGPEPTYQTRYQSLINAFPMLYELWHGTLDTVAPPRTSGSFRFATPYWINGNRRILHAYSDAVGYGWQLGDWCPAGKLNSSLPDDNRTFGQSARFTKILFSNTVVPAENPDDFIDFEIKVLNGVYRVRAEIGDQYNETHQTVEFEGVEAGTFELPKGSLAWTKEHHVTVADNQLTIRLRLAGPDSAAAIRELYFIKRAD